MTRAKSRTIESILWDFHIETTKSQGHPPYDKYTKQLETLILDCLPEKLGMTGANAQDVENFGYNQALSDTKANLLKILGGER